jgi:hypothetical protein
VKKSWYPFKINSIKLSIYGDDNDKSKSHSLSQSNGYFTISQVTPKLGFQIYESPFSSDAEQLYYDQRIENIFYSESWLYILFFIALYLIFIPLCTIVDCCEQGHHLRKKVGSEETSM